MLLKFPVFLGIDDDVAQTGVFTRDGGCSLLDDLLPGFVFSSYTSPAAPSWESKVHILGEIGKLKHNTRMKSNDY